MLSIVAVPKLGASITGSNVTLTASGGIVGSNYVVEASTNIANTNGWVPVKTNTVPGNGSINYSDTNTLKARFYRVEFSVSLRSGEQHLSRTVCRNCLLVGVDENHR